MGNRRDREACRARRPRAKKKPPEGGPLIDTTGLLVFFHCVLYIACGIVRGAFCLVELALCLQLRIAGQAANSILCGAFNLVGRTLHMLIIHLASPLRYLST